MDEEFGWYENEIPGTLDEFADTGFEFVTYIAGSSNDPLPLDGWARHFMNDYLEDALDPTVITNSDDTEILAIFWHSD